MKSALLVVSAVEVLLRSNDDFVIFGNPAACHFTAILPKGIEFAPILQSRQAHPNAAAVPPAEREVVD